MNKTIWTIAGITVVVLVVYLVLMYVWSMMMMALKFLPIALIIALGIYLLIRVKRRY